MEVLFGIILFFILVYYGFKFFLRYGLPWLIARFMKNQQTKYNQHYGHRQNQETGKKKGYVRIKADKSNQTIDDTGFGEYVDYEDVQE